MNGEKGSGFGLIKYYPYKSVQTHGLWSSRSGSHLVRAIFFSVTFLIFVALNWLADLCRWGAEMLHVHCYTKKFKGKLWDWCMGVPLNLYLMFSCIHLFFLLSGCHHCARWSHLGASASDMVWWRISIQGSFNLALLECSSFNRLEYSPECHGSFSIK